MKKNILLSLICVAGLFTFQLVASSFTNSGSMYGPTLDINIDLCENNGKMAASNLLNINVKTLQGSGSLAGSVTNIACDNYYLAGSVSAAKNVILEQKYLSQVEQLIRAALA